VIINRILYRLDKWACVRGHYFNGKFKKKKKKWYKEKWKKYTEERKKKEKENDWNDEKKIKENREEYRLRKCRIRI